MRRERLPEKVYQAAAVVALVLGEVKPVIKRTAERGIESLLQAQVVFDRWNHNPKMRPIPQVGLRRIVDGAIYFDQIALHQVNRAVGFYGVAGVIESTTGLYALPMNDEFIIPVDTVKSELTRNALTSLARQDN